MHVCVVCVSYVCGVCACVLYVCVLCACILCVHVFCVCVVCVHVLYTCVWCVYVLCVHVFCACVCCVHVYCVCPCVVCGCVLGVRMFNHSNVMYLYLIIVLICNFVVTDHVEHFFMYLFAIYLAF